MYALLREVLVGQFVWLSVCYMLFVSDLIIHLPSTFNFELTIFKPKVHEIHQIGYLNTWANEILMRCCYNFRLDQTLGKPNTLYSNCYKDRERMTIGARMVRMENQVSVSNGSVMTNGHRRVDYTLTWKKCFVP